jgi:ubiquinol-cytochrome c reductase cytochrome c1 subunit
MTVAMRSEDAARWLGVPPPDLSVTARARGAAWLYTYFMTFYRDPSRPTGVNNLAFKDVGMPHVLWELQGWQQPVMVETTGSDGTVQHTISELELISPGSLGADGYKRAVSDLVNFLVYLGEPIQLKRHTIGAWVIVYLLVLLVVVYLMKREYWKDVH